MNLVRRPRRLPAGAQLVIALGIAVAFVGLGGAGCSRAHLTPTFGRSFHEVFAIQDANPNRHGTAKSVHGLDSQEAAIIAGSYRRALAPKMESGGNNGQVVLMSPNRGGGAESAVLAPSVPSGN